jgi:GxxExxY protein
VRGRAFGSRNPRKDAETAKRERTENWTMPQTPKHEFEQLSYKVIGACIDVQRQLNTHCTEIDYQRALEIALPKFGVQFEREVEIPIVYDGVTVTKRGVDFICWDERDRLLMETKAAQVIRPEDTEQCLLYATKSNERLILLVNFGEKPLHPRRFVRSIHLLRIRKLPSELSGMHLSRFS